MTQRFFVPRPGCNEGVRANQRGGTAGGCGRAAHQNADPTRTDCRGNGFPIDARPTHMQACLILPRCFSFRALDNTWRRGRRQITPPHARQLGRANSVTIHFGGCILGAPARTALGGEKKSPVSPTVRRCIARAPPTPPPGPSPSRAAPGRISQPSQPSILTLRPRRCASSRDAAAARVLARSRRRVRGNRRPAPPAPRPPDTELPPSLPAPTVPTVL